MPKTSTEVIQITWCCERYEACTEMASSSHMGIKVTQKTASYTLSHEIQHQREQAVLQLVKLLGFAREVLHLSRYKETRLPLHCCCWPTRHVFIQDISRLSSHSGETCSIWFFESELRGLQICGNSRLHTNGTGRFASICKLTCKAFANVQEITPGHISKFRPQLSSMIPGVQILSRQRTDCTGRFLLCNQLAMKTHGAPTMRATEQTRWLKSCAKEQKAKAHCRLTAEWVSNNWCKVMAFSCSPDVVRHSGKITGCANVTDQEDVHHKPKPGDFSF